jgi:hypothetical protein
MIVGIIVAIVYRWELERPREELRQMRGKFRQMRGGIMRELGRTGEDLLKPLGEIRDLLKR